MAKLLSAKNYELMLILGLCKGKLKTLGKSMVKAVVYSFYKLFIMDVNRDIVYIDQDGSISSYNRTPGYGGAATPMYGRDGSKTPMQGSQTPLYEGK